MFLRSVICALVLTTACGPSGDPCGVVRMRDPVRDLCVCRPEYTQVGDLCIPNDEVDAAVDAGSDTLDDVLVDSPTTLTVLSTNPDDGDELVDPTAALSIVFSGEVEASSLDSNIALSADGEAVATTTTWDAASRTATLTPSIRLALEQTYQVVVGTGVATPDGTALVSEHRFEFETRDGAWGEPTLLETRGDDAVRARPVVAAPADGGVVCWLQDDATEASVWCTEYAGGWSDAHVVDATDEPVSRVAIARGSDESVMAIWSQGATSEQRSARYTDGWAAPEPTGGNGRPILGADGAGGFVAVWSFGDGIGATAFQPDTGWTGLSEQTRPVAPADLTAGVGTNGDTVAVWREGPTRDGGTIMAARYVAAGWTTSEQISRARATEIGNPSAVFDDSGIARAAWIERRNSDPYDIVFGAFDPASGWGVGQVIDEEPDTWTLFPRLSTFGDEVLVSFCVYRTEYRARRFSEATGWGSPEVVGPSPSCGEGFAPSFDPLVSDHGIDAAGRAILVWVDAADGSADGVWSRRTALGWSSPAPLESGLELVGNPRIDVHPSGRAIATWVQSDGTRYNVWARVFE